MRFRHDCSQFIGPAFNKVRPKAGGITTDFEYSAAGARVRRVRGEQEIVYLGDVYEHETNGNTITERIYVSNDERVVAIAERINGAETWQFVHTDHLGSVDAISDAAGNEVERRNFDAWGAPRNPKWGNPGPVANGTGTRRGFTWHESDDEVGLVNAKGRLYDPKISRFLQVDPIISEPLDAQTHNPYSYVRNRPLVFTDPSGFTEEEAWRLWRADETGPLGLHITYDKLTPPAPRPHFDPRAPAPPSTAEAAPSTADKAGPAAMTSGDKLVAGVGDGVVELVEHADEMVPGSLAELGATLRLGHDIATTVAKGETVDAINKVNPLMGVTRLGFAIDEEDWYTVGRESVGVGVAIVMAVVAKKASSGVSGSTRVQASSPSSAYSVAVETTIPRQGVGTRGAHFKAANEALINQMKSDADFAAAIHQQGINVPTTSVGSPLPQSPAGWTWHHVPDRPGVMQLIPTKQHQAKGLQPFLHPGRVGGFKLWGADF